MAKLECVEVADFKSASVLVDRLGVEQIASIDIYLADTEITNQKEVTDDFINQIRKVFLNRITKKEIFSMGMYVLIDEDVDEIVLQDDVETINHIHKIAKFEEKNSITFQGEAIYVFLNPRGDTGSTK